MLKLGNRSRIISGPPLNCGPEISLANHLTVIRPARSPRQLFTRRRSSEGYYGTERRVRDLARWLLHAAKRGVRRVLFDNRAISGSPFICADVKSKTPPWMEGKGTTARRRQAAALQGASRGSRMMVLQIARDFTDRINAHDTPGLIALMSPDHALIDSLGNKVTRPAIEAGWAAYFAMVPDYWIRIDRAMSEGDVVALFGSAGGTYVPKAGEPKPENRWETPAAWLATVREGKVSQWRVYCDNEPIREKMRTAGS